MIIKIFICLFILGLILLFDGMLECKRFKVKKYEIIDSKIKHQLNIVVFADLHNVFYDDNNKSIVDKIKKLSPDFILIPGDLLVFRLEELEKGKRTLQFLNSVAKIAPVYYSLGNHEKNIRRPKEDNFSIEELAKFNEFWGFYLDNLDDNIHLLVDEDIVIECKNQKINIFGYDLPMKYYKRLTKPKMQSDEIDIINSYVKDDCYNILLAHNPDFFDAYSLTNFDLVFSGHNHGGVMKIPFWRGVISPRLQIFPKYTHGIYKNNNTRMVLTNGLGIHTFKIRINNVPELVSLKINKTN